MRIATFNINGITSRLPVLLRWLEASRPDVVCLQELKSEVGDETRDQIAQAGYKAVWHGQKRWNGVAILSRHEPVEVRRDLPKDPDTEQARYLEVAVRGILIAGFYAPNGNPWPGPKFDYKLAWLKELRRHAKSLFKTDAPVVLTGDFNIIPGPDDVYKPERWEKDALYAPQARSLYAGMLEDGWVDALDRQFAGDPPYTFWPYWRRSFARDAGIRIDHALLNGPAAEKLKGAGVDRDPRGWEGASDHTPVWIDLDVGS